MLSYLSTPSVDDLDDDTYTGLTLKFGVNLLNASVSCVHCIASKCAHDFDWDWQHVYTVSHCATLIRVPLSQIIIYSDTKEPALVVMECKRANVIYVCELIFLLHTSRSTEVYSSRWKCFALTYEE